MKSCLIDTIFLSDKRKNLLLLLLEGMKNSDEIKDRLNVNWGAMIPQIKKLEEWNLINSKDRVYSLTEMGYSIAYNSKNLLDILYFYEKNNEYLSNHKLDCIPEHLMNRIGEISSCHVIESDLAHVFDANEEVVNAMIGASTCITLTTFFQPQYNKMYNSMIKNNCDITFVFSSSVWERTKSLYVYDGKSELDEYNFLNWKKANIYTIPDGLNLLELSITEDTLLLAFFSNDGRFDSRYLIGHGKGTYQWGIELYNNLMINSKLVHTKEIKK